MKTKFLFLSAPASWLLRLGGGEEGSVTGRRRRRAAVGASQGSRASGPYSRGMAQRKNLDRFRPPLPQSRLKREHVEERRNLGDLPYCHWLVKTGPFSIATITEERVARLVCIDQPSDLAVLRVQGSNLPFINLRHAMQAKPRELSLAFGNPFGMDRTVTMGILSAVNRWMARITRGCHFRQMRPSIPVIPEDRCLTCKVICSASTLLQIERGHNLHDAPRCSEAVVRWAR